MYRTFSDPSVHCDPMHAAQHAADVSAMRDAFYNPRQERVSRGPMRCDVHVKYFLAVKFTPNFFFTFFGPYLSPGHAEPFVSNDSSVIDIRTKKFSDPTTIP